MKNCLTFYVSVLSAFLLAGCGGSGSVTNSLPQTSSGRPQAHFNSHASAEVKVHIPAPTSTTSRTRKPLYVSPSTDEIWISMYNPNDPSNSPLINQFAVNSTNCTTNSDGSRDCTFLVENLPAGLDTFAILATRSELPFVPAPLGYVQGVQGTIGGGKVTHISATLNGVINSINFSLGSLVDTNHLNLVLSALDFASNKITTPGLYAHPIKLVDSDTSGQTGLIVNGHAPCTTAFLNSPADLVILFNTGSGSVDLQITASSQVFTRPDPLFPNDFQLAAPAPVTLSVFCSPTGCVASGSASIGIN